MFRDVLEGNRGGGVNEREAENDLEGCVVCFKGFRPDF